MKSHADRVRYGRLSFRAVSLTWLITSCAGSLVITPHAAGYSFIPLVPQGGAIWEAPGATHLAVHPSKNRIYTVALGPEGYVLVHRDSISGAVIASTTVSADPTWWPVDVEVWDSGDEVLVAWSILTGSTERDQPVALERFDVATGHTIGATSAAAFHAFAIDEPEDRAWGIISAGLAGNYSILSLDLSTGVTAATETAIAASEAILQDVLIDGSNNVLFALFQPTQPGDPMLADDGGFVVAYSLPSAQLLDRIDIIPPGASGENYRAGGMALDATRALLYTIPFDGGALRRIDVSNPADMVIDATIGEDAIAPDFTAQGAIAVDPGSGFLFLGNGTESQVLARVLLYGVDARSVVEAWTSGADPSRVVYDARLGAVYVASEPSQSVTAIQPFRERELYQAPMGIRPHDLIFDSNHDRLLLLTEGGEIFAVDAGEEVLTDKIDSIGITPLVGMELDSPRNRFLVGTYGQSAPAVFDGETLQHLGTLPLPGSALAVSITDGLILQTSVIPSVAGSLFISAATSGILIRQVEDTATFEKTRGLAADDGNSVLYGLTFPRGAGASPAVWWYNWQTDATGELPLPSGTWGNLSLLSVDQEQGKLAVVGSKSDGYHVLVYDPWGGSVPEDFLLDNMSVSDLLIDEANRNAIVLGQHIPSLAARLAVIPLDTSATPTYPVFDIAHPPEHMALDTSREILWLASQTPSGLYRIPWPPGNGTTKQRHAASTVMLTVDAVPGVNRLRWTIDPPAQETEQISILRQDGGLAAYRPLTPSALPGSATEFHDVDVLPGLSYGYRIELSALTTSASAESDWVSAAPRETETVVARPLTLLGRIPLGGTDTISLYLDGVFRLTRFAEVSVDSTASLEENGIHVDVSSATVPVPGLLRVILSADPDATPGRYPIPISVDTGDDTQLVWLFAEVSVPFGEETVEAPSYPARSRVIGIHTDSQLREESDNLLVIKGELGSLVGSASGTGVVAKVDIGDGQVLEKRDVVASGGRYSISIRLPVLTADTIVRARVTWLGSSNSPGGTSPILHLPVGAYSVVASGGKPLIASASPEPAIFILGETPSGLNPQPTDNDLRSIVEDAEETLLAEFKPAERNILESEGDVGSAMVSAQDAGTVLVYAVADTSDGTIRLPGGTGISPQELGGMITGLGENVRTILIVEGPRSGSFAQTSLYPAGTTVLTSCAAGEGNNRMSPWYQSFSALFLAKCRSSLSVARSFYAAELGFLDPFAGQIQSPQFIKGESSDIQLSGRFISAELPDLAPPGILDVFPTDLAGATPPLELRILVGDNRDAREQIQVEAEILWLDGRTLTTVEFFPPLPGESHHRGQLESIPIPGFGLRAVATDTAGNRSDPFTIWLSDSSRILLYDLDGNDVVDEVDLLQLLSLESSWGAVGGWLFEFATEWHKTPTD